MFHNSAPRLHWRCFWPPASRFRPNRATPPDHAAHGRPPVRFENSPRVHELIRAGNLYLSLQDALALAIENNLDIELQRYLLPIGDTELLRAKGGGLNRGLNFTLPKSPSAPADRSAPCPPHAAAAGRATAGSSIATNALGLNALGEPQVNDSIQGTIAQSIGTAIPIYDPSIDRTVELDSPDHAADQHRHYRHQHAGDQHDALQRRRAAGLRLRRAGRLEPSTTTACR